MREFMRGSPGAILAIGIGLMTYGFVGTYFLMAFAWGGFLKAPLIVQLVGFGFVGSIFLGGLALASIGACRLCCRRPRSY